jgi:hypothetical protein
MSVKVDVFKSFELSCKALIHPVSWATNGGGLLSTPTVAKTVLRLTLKMAADRDRMLLLNVSMAFRVLFYGWVLERSACGFFIV